MIHTHFNETNRHIALFQTFNLQMRLRLEKMKKGLALEIVTPWRSKPNESKIRNYALNPFGDIQYQQKNPPKVQRFFL